MQTSSKPSPMASSSPLMGEVLPLCHPVPVAGLLLPPLPRFVQQWGAYVGLLGLPHHLYQAMHEGRALLLEGCPLFILLVRGTPPLLLLQAMRRERTLLGGCPPLPPLGTGVPPYSSPTCCARGAHTAVQGGPTLPLPPGCMLRWRTTWSGWPPLSPACARGAHAAFRGGAPSHIPLVAL